MIYTCSRSSVWLFRPMAAGLPCSQPHLQFITCREPVHCSRPGTPWEPHRSTAPLMVALTHSGWRPRTLQKRLIRPMLSMDPSATFKPSGSGRRHTSNTRMHDHATKRSPQQAPEGQGSESPRAGTPFGERLPRAASRQRCATASQASNASPCHKRRARHTSAHGRHGGTTAYSQEKWAGAARQKEAGNGNRRARSMHDRIAGGHEFDPARRPARTA